MASGSTTSRGSARFDAHGAGQAVTVAGAHETLAEPGLAQHRQGDLQPVAGRRGQDTLAGPAESKERVGGQDRLEFSMLMEMEKAGECIGTTSAWRLKGQARTCLAKHYTDGKIDELLKTEALSYADVQAMLKHFRPEFEHHIAHKTCLVPQHAHSAPTAHTAAHV